MIITARSIGENKFQSEARSDGQNMNTYEDSEIDNYLENDWYNSLSSTMKTAIQTTSIKQASYDDSDNKQETGYNGQVYNTISRHAFLPSVSEIGKVVNLKNPDKVKVFLDDYSIWTRDSYQDDITSVEGLMSNGGHLVGYHAGSSNVWTRPAFVIDLSQVNYSVVK